MYLMLVRTRLRGEPTHAAEFAASILHDGVVPSPYDDGKRRGMSFDYTSGRIDIARDRRRDKILCDAPGLIAAATGPDKAWLEISAQLLHATFNAFAIGDHESLTD